MKLKAFFKGVIKESKTVRWPNFKSMLKYSGVTLFLMVFFGLYFYGLDLLFSFIKGLV